MTSVRVSVNPIQFSSSFISKVWASRAELNDEERHGLFQFLYVTSCSSIEAVLSEYMVAVLNWPVHTLATTKVFSDREKTMKDGSKVPVDSGMMNEGVRRLCERTKQELASAPFARLMDLHVTILGKKPAELLGATLYATILGLVAVRNVLAHSRDVYVEMNSDPSGGRYFLPDTNFDAHPLKPAFQALGHARLYDSKASKRSDAVMEVLTQLYREEVMLYFWNGAKDAVDKYVQMAVSQGFMDPQGHTSLPSLGPA
jgi:hypothetical protein